MEYTLGMDTKVALGTFSLLILTTLILPSWALAEKPVQPKYSQLDIEEKWRNRIQSILDRGVVPLIDFLSFLPRENSAPVIHRTKEVMDKNGVALISFAGYWAPRDSKCKGHCWDYFIHHVVNGNPDRFILTTNKGGNKNWWGQKSGKPRDYIEQLEKQVLSGNYPFIGQIEFRHYMSNAQCKARKKHRDINIPVNGSNGHRVFNLSAATGVPVSIHLEPEDSALNALKEMLRTYPKAKVIVSHFGQVRHPEKEHYFGPNLIKNMLATYPNLYFDLSTGEPGRFYICGNHRVLDTVIWADNGRGGQTDSLKPEYKELLEKFSNRFVVGFDFGPPNRQSADYLQQRIENARLILRDLSSEAKHKIGYKNGWFLLTRKVWE